jgi:hypothetical protein
MRTPSRPLPAAVVRWIRLQGYLRWADAAAAWLTAWLCLFVVFPDTPGRALAVLAAVAAGGAALVPGVRMRWRPVSAVAGVNLSAELRVGDRAWWVRPGGAELVLVTSRRGLRVVIARADRDTSEGLAVRRTRVLLLPASRV